MQFKRMHPGFILPTKGSAAAGGYDLYMPAPGRIHETNSFSDNTHTMMGLGFAAKVPDGHVALILPRSGAGAKLGIELRNTMGVIDADYTGEWMVAAKQKEGKEINWNAGDRVFQFIVVPVVSIEPVEVEELETTERGEGGFGSTRTGKASGEAAATEPAKVAEPAPAKVVDQESAEKKVPAKAAEVKKEEPKVDGDKAAE